MYPTVELKTIDKVTKFADTTVEWMENTPIYATYKPQISYFEMYKYVVRVIAFIAHPTEYGEDIKRIKNAAKMLYPRSELRIATVTNKEIVDHFKQLKGTGWFDKTENSLVLIRTKTGDKPETKTFNYDISTRTDIYFQWINDQSLDHLMELGAYSYKIINMLKKPFFVAFLEENNSFKSQKLFKILSDLAPRYPKFEFTYTSNTFYKQKKQSLGITWNEEPSLTFNYGPGQSIPYPQGSDFTEESVKKYMDSILDGSIVPKDVPRAKKSKKLRTFEDA